MALRPFSLFGFRFGHFDEMEKQEEKTKSFVAPTNDDASATYEVGTAGTFQIVYDFEGIMNDEKDLINKYRDMSINASIEPAIDEVINDIVVVDKKEPPIQLVIGEHRLLSHELKDKIMNEFMNVLRLLNFQNNAYDIVRRWYIDGRLYYHILIDREHPDRGIQELRYIDPRMIKKWREIVKTKDQKTNAELVQKIEEYFIFNKNGFLSSDTKNVTGLRIHPDSIVFCHSGLLNTDNTLVLSYLHKAIRPFNQLRAMEDSLVIYRMTRAPERRIFNIDVGEMPPVKAKQYLESIRDEYKTRLIYNPTTGELKDDRRHSTITEDFWFPKRGDGRNSEVTTLAGGQNLSQIEDIEYFQKSLYKSLNIPISRLDPTNGFNLGKASEITREEVKFAKFITRLRFKLNRLFDATLKRQLILKKITTEEDWEQIKECIYYDYLSDSHYAELKALDVMNTRLEALDKASQYTEGDNKYFSKEFIKHNILMQTDKETEEIDKNIKKDKNEGNAGAEEEAPAKVGGGIEEPSPEEVEAPPEEEK